MKTVKIAIDGPSGAGKSFLAKKISEILGYVYIDTGALYRSIGYAVIENNISPSDASSVIGFLDSINISFKHIDGLQHVFVNENDVTGNIRNNEVSAAASAVSAIPEVRKYLFGLQRSIAETNNVVMDGRDIGTVILPDADVKLFLTASVASRANRRYLELKESNSDITLDEVIESIIKRDKNDSERAVAPLKPAHDSVLVDNSEMTREETVDKVLKIIENKINV